MIEYKNEYLLTRFNGSGIRAGEKKNMNSKNFKVRKISNNKEHYYISNKDGILVLKNGNISAVSFHCYWESKKEAEIFLAGWEVLNPLPKPELDRIDFEPEYELGTRYVDASGRVYKYYKFDDGVVIDCRWILIKL